MTRSEIFKAAWLNIKQNGVSLSVALKAAWAASKAPKLEIGQLAINIVTNKVEKITKIKYGYINGYKEDLWKPYQEVQAQQDILPQNLLTDVALRIARWNGKFYGEYIYINGRKYLTTITQRSELSRHFEVEY